MGLAVLELAPPSSVNRAPARSSRGAGIGRHKAKRALEAELATLLMAAGVPKPIPGDRVRATAELLFPIDRRRDEGNYRGPLEKALGDALCPHQTKEERELGLPAADGYLTDDDAAGARFTFGAITFGQTELERWTDARGRGHSARRPALCRIRLVWGDDLAGELERELAELQERVSA